MHWLSQPIADAVGPVVRVFVRYDAPISRFIGCNEPLCKGGAQVKANLGKVAGLSIGPIALGIDTLIPVGKWRCIGLSWNLPCQRICAGWLVEVSVDGKVAPGI